MIGVPAAFLGIFFLAPFFVVGAISLSDPMIARPPVSPLFEEGRFVGDLENYVFLSEDPLYVAAYLNSLRIAAISTALTLLLGYPMAYVIARSPEPRRSILLMLVILPFWTSFLLRVYALIGLMDPNGAINAVLLGLGWISAPLVMRQTDFAVFVGVVYTYLPFMVLPLYATLSRLDETMLEASADLGARPVQSFVRITLPLSLPGILAGSLLVFIPVIGEFVIPALLGGPDSLMIGQVLWNEFFSARDWTLASAVAVVMLLAVVLPLAVLRRVVEAR
ncbi:MAG: ABC transporter permease subunit [Pseudomonadota bacterium]